MRQYEEAIAQFKASLEKDPLNANIYFNLGGVSYSALKRRPEAVQNFAGAILIRPGYAEAHNEMGVALALDGKIDEAVLHFRDAVSIKPNYPAARQNLDTALKAQSEGREGP